MKGGVDLALFEEPRFGKAVLDTIGALVVVVESNGNIVYVNRACQELTGYVLDEMRGQSWERFLIPEEAEAAKAVFRSLTASQFPNTHENYWVTRSGEARRVAWSNTAILDHDGQVGYVIGTGIDVTEQHRSQQALRESEAKYRAVMESANDGIVVADLDGKILDVNKRMAQLLGYRREALIGMSARNIHPPGEEANLRAAWGDIQRTGRSLYEHLVLRRDGTTAPVEVGGALLELDGRPVMMGIFRDISERKRAETEMAKLSRALDQTADSVMISDASGRIEYVNRGFEEITGYSAQQVLGQNPRILRSGVLSVSFYREMWETILGGRVFRAVFVNRNADGSLYDEDKTISPLRDETGKISHFISTARDVTDRRLAEQARLSQEKTQRAALVREVHHRIKNHLQGLTGLLNQHLGEHAGLAGPLRTAISQIRSVAVVHGLQGASASQEILLNEMVGAICQSIGSLHGREIDLQTTGNEAFRTPIAAADAVSVSLVLNELIVNAVKHSGAESATPQVRLRRDSEGKATVSVRNQGGPLPPGFDIATKRGLGTGLSLARALLPYEGAKLTIAGEQDMVCARLTLSEPTIEVTTGGGAAESEC